MNTASEDTHNQIASCKPGSGLRHRLARRLGSFLRRRSLPIAATVLALLIGLPDELVDLMRESPARGPVTQCCAAPVNVSLREPLLTQTWNSSGQSIVLLAQAKTIATEMSSQLISKLF